ncbi:MAG: hypothetical protein KIT69_11305, partial [Propionibacteriaceae bacterium]|nr:hypothetical protein [Propionibacteriaceae bacterium]
MKPSLNAKPMARMWLPDAGAGASKAGLAMVEKHIKEMAAAGFGGVEVAYLADDSSVTNDELATVGWGSENWQRILKTMLRTANSISTGFKIDITITAHWPPAVNTIDPNDDAQQQQATVAYRKLTAEDVANGVASVPLPTQRTQDYYQTGPAGGGPLAAAPFLFVDKFSAATIATVKSVGSNGTPVFELDSLTDLTDATAANLASDDEIAAGEALERDGTYYAGYAAGIPDAAAAAELGVDYQTAVVDQFGPEPADSGFEGKIDSDGNRKRMADWQYTYSTDLSAVDLADYTPSDGDGYAVGDKVLIGSYHQGTGQLMSGGASGTMHNRAYATDYFSTAGVQQIFDVWDENILDKEMVRLLKENGKQGTSIFEDSIEVHSSSPIWTADLLSEASEFNGYDLTKYAPVLALGSAARFDDSTAATRIIEDYNQTLGHLYESEHAELIKNWADSFGYTYRAQAYTLSGLDVGAAAAALDIPEGDNSTAGDGLRNLQGAANLGRKSMLSMESYTGGTIFSTWDEVAKVVNSDLSDGVNRAVFHGTALATAFNGYRSSWPGWNFWRETSIRPGGFSTYDYRQIWWDDADTFSNFVARSQGVMQAGQAKVDVAVLIGSDAGYSLQSGNSMQELLDAGYSYNIVSQALLDEPTAVVSNGVLDPKGAQYKALVVKDAGKLSAATVSKLVGYAKKGLPIIVLGDGPTRVYGTSKAGNTDADMLAKWSTLTGMSGVAEVADSAAVLASLQSEGVTPNASYDVPMLETSSRTDSNTTYYYLYNSGSSISSAAAAGDSVLKMASAAGLAAGDKLLVGTGSSQEVVEVASLTAPASGGSQFPWEVNPWTVELAEPLQQAHASGAAVSGLA